MGERECFSFLPSLNVVCCCVMHTVPYPVPFLVQRAELSLTLGVRTAPALSVTPPNETCRLFPRAVNTGFASSRAFRMCSRQRLYRSSPLPYCGFVSIKGRMRSTKNGRQGGAQTHRRLFIFNHSGSLFFQLACTIRYIHHKNCGAPLYFEKSIVAAQSLIFRVCRSKLVQYDSCLMKPQAPIYTRTS